MNTEALKDVGKFWLAVIGIVGVSAGVVALFAYLPVWISVTATVAAIAFLFSYWIYKDAANEYANRSNRR